MTALLKFTTIQHSARTVKELEVNQGLVVGDKLKLEIGDAELSERCPEGKAWTVHAIIKVAEDDV